MKNKEMKVKAMSMAVAMSMVVGLCPSTIFAATGSQTAKDGTYTKTSNGITVTLSEVYYNKNAMYIAMSLYSEEPFPEDIKIKDEHGSRGGIGFVPEVADVLVAIV